jgi:hypothetical protein
MGKSAEEIAGKHQALLSRALFKQETQRDKTLVLVSGGALSVSFAFIASLVEHSKAFPLGLLIAAWAAWVGVLALTLVGYTVSIAVYKRVIQAFSNAQWAVALKGESPLSKCIEPLNILGCVLTVAGFVCFGWFCVSVLRSTANDQIHDQVQRAQEIQRHATPSQSELHPAAAPLPPTQENK